MLKHLVVGSAILFGSSLVAGCGVSGNLAATPTGNGTTHLSDTVQTRGVSTPSTSASPNAGSSSPFETTLASTPSSSQSTSPAITLENVQISNGGVDLYTTHGTMQTAYKNPRIVAGSPNVFEITLVNTSPGRFSVNHTKSITSNWATTEEMIPQGPNLLLQFDLRPLIHQFQVGIGGGDIIGISFNG